LIWFADSAFESCFGLGGQVVFTVEELTWVCLNEVDQSLRNSIGPYSVIGLVSVTRVLGPL